MQESHNNSTENLDVKVGKDGLIESILEKIIFGSRWILSIFYLMLVLTLLLVAVNCFC